MKYLALFCLLMGCSANYDKVKNILEAEGCTNTVVSGWELFACGKDDSFTNTFVCEKNGKIINGVVCSGLFKGYTIRYF